jgi:ABC-type phosphate transport system auxiliary subunit
MGPLYTVFLCLPAGLALIIAVCGLAVLWPQPVARAQRRALAPLERVPPPPLVSQGGRREP